MRNACTRSAARHGRPRPSRRTSTEAKRNRDADVAAFFLFSALIAVTWLIVWLCGVDDDADMGGN